MKNHHRTTSYLLLAGLCLLSNLALGQPAFDSDPSRPKIGLALGGGGAKGSAHIGILRVLEELHIPVSYIAGSSMGSIVAGLYASGMSPDDIEANLLAIDWDDLMQDKPSRQDQSYWRKQDDGEYLIKMELGLRDGKVQIPKGLILGQKFNVLLKWFTLPVARIEDFNQLPIPFRPIAVDIADGSMVAIDSGNLADAIRASAALPGIFAPVKLQDRLLIDGAMAKNLPVDVVRQMGADVVIAVDVGSKYASVESLHSALDISTQAMLISTRKDADLQIASLTPRDVLLVPPLNHIQTLDFSKSSEAISIGEVSAREKTDKLKQYSVNDTQWHQYLKSHRTPQEREVTVKRIRVMNRSAVADTAIEKHIHMQPGTRLSLHALRRDISEIYGMGDFEQVNFFLHTTDGDTELVYEPVAKSWGPNYLRFGVNLQDNFEGASSYQLAMSYNKTQINQFRGEWKTVLQLGEEQRLNSWFFQPLGYSDDYYLLAGLGGRRFFPDVTTGVDTVKYEVRGGLASISLGRQIGPKYGTVQVGLQKEWLHGEPQVRSTGLQRVQATTGGIYAGLSYDQIDNVNFPKSGSEITLLYTLNRERYGADAEYDKLGLAGARFRTWGVNTFMLGARLASSLDTDLPFYDQYGLGGFTSLSGYQSGELRGNHLALLKALYLRRIGGSGGVLDGTYLGMSVEGGNVWQTRDDAAANDLIYAGSVFLGLDTLVGPVYLGYGRAENNVDSLYLFLGKTF